MESLEELRVRRTLISFLCLLLLLGWESFKPFAHFFRGKARARGIHGSRNLFLGIANSLLTALLFTSLWTIAAGWSENARFGLVHRLGWDGWKSLGAQILLLDFWTFWWHWMNHRWPFLWRFHRVHHSDACMDVTTASRFHTGEILASSLLRVPIIMILGIGLPELVVYEALLFIVVQFHHANVGLPESLDKWLRLVIPTPVLHKVHHSIEPVEANSNYGSLFSFWDRVFGTLRLRSDLQNIQFGVRELATPERQTLTGLLKTPFLKNRKPSEQFEESNRES